MGDPARKRISFEVPEDSDEDTNAVEVGACDSSTVFV
jgi:hypothetical protein